MRQGSSTSPTLETSPLERSIGAYIASSVFIVYRPNLVTYTRRSITSIRGYVALARQLTLRYRVFSYDDYLRISRGVAARVFLRNASLRSGLSSLDRFAFPAASRASSSATFAAATLIRAHPLIESDYETTRMLAPAQQRVSPRRNEMRSQVRR